MTCRIGAEGDRVLRHRYRGSAPTMPVLMETRAPPPPGSPSGPMIPEPTRRSTSAELVAGGQPSQARHDDDTQVIYESLVLLCQKPS
jgi:hypothetical protein